MNTEERERENRGREREREVDDSVSVAFEGSRGGENVHVVGDS